MIMAQIGKKEISKISKKLRHWAQVEWLIMLQFKERADKEDFNKYG